MPTISRAVEREIGYVQPIAWHGLVIDATEETPELQWPLSVKVYDRMRRQDAQTAAVLMAVTLPIRGFDWRIDPRGASPEVTRFVAEDLGLPVVGETPKPQPRTRDRFSWDEHLRMALLDLAYGHMPFEQVYRIVDGQARLRKLSPRMPASLTKINVERDGGLRSVEQASDGLDGRLSIEIPVDRLVWYANDREGGNWTGTSVLRRAYKHWLLKDRLIRVDAMTAERNGMGVPWVEAPPNASKADIDRLAVLAQSFRSGEKAGGAGPNGAKLTLRGVEGTLPDILAKIRYHDEQIARSMLAQFLQLGSTETGSRALGESFIDFFQLAMVSVAKQVADVTTQHQIEDSVDLNFGGSEPAPAVVASDAEAKAELAPSDLADLVYRGVIRVDEELETHIRDQYKLPKPGAARPVPAPTPATGPVPLPTAAARAAQQPAVGHRLPTEIELAASTDFVQVQTSWETAVDRAVREWGAVRAAQVDELTEQIRSFVDAGDVGALADIQASPGGSLVLSEFMADLADRAADQAAAEAARQGVTIGKPDLGVVGDSIAARADATDRLLARSISEVAGRQAINRMGSEATGETVAAAVREHLEGLSDSYLRDQLGGALTSAQNTGRWLVMGSEPATYYASELLDTNTCSNCSAIDGKRYQSLAEAALDYPTGGHADCLGGVRCRGTLVAIYEEAAPSVPEAA